MCLTLCDGWLKKTKRYKNKKKPIKAYKVLMSDKCGAIQYFQWKMGWNQSSRLSTVVSLSERSSKQIGNGFHFFLSIKAARKFANGNNNIWECEILPAHVVATGGFAYYHSLSNMLGNSNPQDGGNCLVATKAKLVRKVK